MTRDLIELVGNTPPASVVMLTGAGVSVEGPSSLPTGWELTERVFGAFFEPGTLAAVLASHAAVNWLAMPACPDSAITVPEPRLPRLETVLGVAARVYGHPAIADVLADVRDARPNRLHAFFAAHLSLGGRHITANFDRCVQLAADHRHPGWRSAGQVHHFHGSLESDPSARSLGATLDRIQGGFDDAAADSFRRALPADGILAVFGYSGSDFFDVDAVIAALPPGALAAVRVVWVLHGGHRWHLVDPGSEHLPYLVRLLRQAGARVDIACGQTAEFVAGVAGLWGAGRVGRGEPRRLRFPGTSADDGQRQRATLLLYRELGLYQQIGRVIDAGRPAGVDAVTQWLARSELLWERGQWGTLRRMWQRGDRPAGISAAQRAERIGASLWVQGRLVPAYLWLTWHRRKCADPADKLMLAETEGRVIEHMARVPDLRVLAARLAPSLVSALGETSQRAGVHLYRRRNDLVSSLRTLDGAPRETDEAQTSQRWFTEAGNLLSALNYRHRQYRDDYPALAGHLTNAELGSRYRELQRHFEAVGSVSGSIRTHLLPGAERVFTLGEVTRGLLALQYGWWQRIRLLARFSALKLRRLRRR